MALLEDVVGGLLDGLEVAARHWWAGLPVALLFALIFQLRD